METIAHKSNFPVIICGEKYNGEYTREQILKMEIIGWTKDNSLLKKLGLTVSRRKELNCQPILKDYIGPMWDNGKLRYESQEVYNMLSI